MYSSCLEQSQGPPIQQLSGELLLVGVLVVLGGDAFTLALVFVDDVVEDVQVTRHSRQRGFVMHWKYLPHPLKSITVSTGYIIFIARVLLTLHCLAQCLSSRRVRHRSNRHLRPYLTLRRSHSSFANRTWRLRRFLLSWTEKLDAGRKTPQCAPLDCHLRLLGDSTHSWTLHMQAIIRVRAVLPPTSPS